MTKSLPTDPLTDASSVLNVNKVQLGEKGFENFEDIGGPVYLQTDYNGNITAQALGHIASFFTDNSTYN
ncbi:7598_t:CDS:1, partial [Dentiscutata erythropus]